jgi:hypothetical protein
LDRGSTSLKLVDDCGNVWECILIFGTAHDHCRIDGQWKCFVEAHNGYEWVRMRLRAAVVGDNEMLYVQVYSSSVWRGLSWDVLELIS